MALSEMRSQTSRANLAAANIGINGRLLAAIAGAAALFGCIVLSCRGYRASAAAYF